jgi:transcription elongation factor GreA
VAEKVYFSEEGFKKLEAELNHLKTVKRPEVSKAVGHAISLGDLRENGEYESAKHAQGLLEDRIKDLEDRLSRATIVQAHNIPDGKVALGTAVSLKDLDTGEKIRYSIVGPDEADLEALKISVQSLIARSLIGRSEGEEVKVQIPAGVKRFKLLKIEKVI